jgi:hypothetical protein
MGSDGIETPELHWISAILGQRALGVALDRLSAARILAGAEVEGIAQDILHRTTRRVYRLAAG